VVKAFEVVSVVNLVSAYFVLPVLRPKGKKKYQGID